MEKINYKKLKLDDFIEVRWVDQSVYRGPINDPNGAIQEIHGTTLGYFVEQDEKWLCIAQERFESPGQDTSYRQLLTFPKVCITGITNNAR